MQKRFLTITALVLSITGCLILFVQFWIEISDARAQAESGSEILETSLGNIEYAIRGEGVPVLVLHGAGGGYDQGLLLGLTSFGDGYKIVSVSRFGYLRSPIPDDSSLESQAALYALLLDDLGIEKVVVTAGSAGGPSAMQFVHDYPDRCKALILISAISQSIAADKDAVNTRVIHLIQKSDFVYWLFTKAFRSMFLQLIGIPPDVYADFTDEQKVLAQNLLDVMHPMSQRRAGSVHEFEMIPLDRESLNDINIPTLILHAKDDALVNFEHAIFAHDNITQSQLILYKSGGHGLLSQMSDVRQNVHLFLDEYTVP
jgi:pimeloyl-ACP methyl ester carboxylesterase